MPRRPRYIRADETLYLRRPSACDKNEYLALREASREFLEPWEPIPPDNIPWNHPSLFDRYLRAARRKDTSRLLVCERTNNAIIGSINLNNIILGPLRSAFLGYWIAKPHANKGHMTRAIPLALDHAFQDLRLRRVEANVQPANNPSIALINKLGFRKEGFSPDYLLIQGKPADHERWAILATGWNEQPRRASTQK